MYKESLRSNTTQEHLLLLLPQYGGWEWAKTWGEGRGRRRGWAKWRVKLCESSPPQLGRADLRLDFQAVQVASGSHVCTCRSRLICCSLVHRLSWLVASSRILVSNLRFCSFCKVHALCNLSLYLFNCFLRSLEKKQVWVRVETHTYGPAGASQVLLVGGLCPDYHLTPPIALSALCRDAFVLWGCCSSHLLVSCNLW